MTRGCILTFPKVHIILHVLVVLGVLKLGTSFHFPFQLERGTSTGTRTDVTLYSQLQPSNKPNTDTDSSTTRDVTLWNQENLIEFASQQGILLSLSTLGPGYRVIARAKHNTDLILGYCEGFLRPVGNIMHLDKMEVYQKMVRQAKRENQANFSVRSGSFFGTGLLLGFLCLLHAQENGCKTAEFLAIHDQDEQHRKLVQYYKRSGFEIIKYVGDDAQDIPDRLVWGGCGTLMKQEVPLLITNWSNLLQKSKDKMEADKKASTTPN